MTAPAAAPAHADALAELRAAIERINVEAPAAIRRRDAAALAAWFAPGARLYAHGAGVVEGREEIERLYESLFAPPTSLRDATFRLLELEVGGEWGWETGANTLTLEPPGAPGPVVIPGKYLAVWRRGADGRWLLWRHAPSSDVVPGRA